AREARLCRATKECQPARDRGGGLSGLLLHGAVSKPKTGRSPPPFPGLPPGREHRRGGGAWRSTAPPAAFSLQRGGPGVPRPVEALGRDGLAECSRHVVV